jgi:FixJ family two-component response regulator/signal transduction histidine kinase
MSKRARVGRLAFERMLAELASRFADVPSGNVPEEIERALLRMVEFLGYDRCTYGEFSADGALIVIASAAAAGLKPHRLGAFGEAKSWFLGELRAGRAVVLPALPRGLPPHARAEREDVKRSGLRSHLSIPVRARGRTTSVLAFAGFRAARDWPAEVVTRLTIIAEVFANSLARARAEEETRELRTRLWHADRVARVSALTAAIAHEINQPLTAILANAQAGLADLERGAANLEELRDILEAVVRDDKRAADTIRTMRSFLRQDESGREGIDLAGALQEVLGLLAVELTRMGIRVHTRLESGCRVRANRTQIEQVVLNLLLNAAQALAPCPAAERLVTLSATRAGADRVAVEVCDTGPGIAPEHLQSAFEPFWTTRKEGLGLGLPICRSIVEAHGGTIRVERNAERGVTFRFELPAEGVAQAGEAMAVLAAAEMLEQTSAAPQTGPLVCVIDDDAAVRTALSRLIAAEGWAAIPYASASEFLQRQALAAVDCILLDQQMPGMTGMELLQQLAGAGEMPPVVFLTGHGELEAGVQAMKLGAMDFLSKPLDLGKLRETVEKAVARRAVARKHARERELYRARLGRLSPREREVMEHVVRGRRNKQIAADLRIAMQTVKQHRGKVMEKMEVSSVADLVRAVEVAGVVPVTET